MKYYKQVQHEILIQEDSANTSHGLNTTLNELNVTLTKACHWVSLFIIIYYDIMPYLLCRLEITLHFPHYHHVMKMNFTVT